MRGTIIIDTDLCKGCQYCIGACPCNVLAIEHTFNAKGFFPVTMKEKDACTGCGLCAQMCPEIAIEVFREEKE